MANLIPFLIQIHYIFFFSEYSLSCLFCNFLALLLESTFRQKLHQKDLFNLPELLGKFPTMILNILFTHFALLSSRKLGESKYCFDSNHLKINSLGKISCHNVSHTL